MAAESEERPDTARQSSDAPHVARPDPKFRLATLDRVLSAYLYTEPATAVSSLSLVSCTWMNRPTSIKHKRHTLARVQEDDCAGIPTVVPLELHGRAVVGVVGEVEEDLVLRRAGHGCRPTGGVSEAQSRLGRRGGLAGDRSDCGEEGRRQ